MGGRNPKEVLFPKSKKKVKMEQIINPVERALIVSELTHDKLLRKSRKGDNEIYVVNIHNAPNTLREIGRLRELTFRASGGGTDKALDLDTFDIDEEYAYEQLIVWDPSVKEIIGGYRYILGWKLSDRKKLASAELFHHSDNFMKEYSSYSIELGRSFVQPDYQGIKKNPKSLYALDNLWDGLGALIKRYPQCKYFIGKVTMYEHYNVDARNILLNYLNIYFGDREELITPIEALSYSQGEERYTKMFEGQNFKEAYKTLQKEVKTYGEFIPPLINSYMCLSDTMKVFGTAINHEFGQVEETGIMITIKDIYDDKLDRYLISITEEDMQSSWWK